jgi:NAD-dependent deacetylase
VGPSVAELTALLRQSRRVLVFTGAGISTASGIPDFRGPGGVWTKRQPVYFDEFLASEEQRIEHWDFKLESWDLSRGARPTATHLALVELERCGILQALVTQNIDGLHQAAGTSEEKLVEVHGTNRWIECLSCGALTEPGPHMERFRANRRAPRCTCGGLLKSATISFGQPLRPAVLERAAREARLADLVLALGSTLSVYPAAQIPLFAADRGLPYCIVNRGATEHDDRATLRFEAAVDDVVPSAVAALTSG